MGAIFLSALLVLLCSWYDGIFLYDRELLAQGEWWRFVSGHASHLSLEHGVINLLALIALLIAGYAVVGLGIGTQLICLLLFSLLVSSGFYLLLPELQFYGGLSGILHGLYVLIVTVYAIALTFPAYHGKSTGETSPSYMPFFIGNVMLAVIVVKLVYDLIYSQNRSFIGVDIPVVAESHLLGAMAGLIVAILLLFLLKSGRIRLTH